MAESEHNIESCCKLRRSHISRKRLLIAPAPVHVSLQLSGKVDSPVPVDHLAEFSAQSQAGSWNFHKLSDGKSLCLLYEVISVFELVPIFTTLSLVATTYAATNLDNLVLLVGWLLAARLPVGKIFAGYFLGMSLILVASIVVGLAGNLFPVEYIRYLGAIPITLGLKMLFDLWRERGRDSDADSSPGMQRIAVSGIFLTQLSNGTDSVLAFAPLLADSRMNIDFIIAIAFMLMVLAWFALAQYATTHAKRVSALTSVAQWVAPIVMIVVGWYIFDNTATDMVPGS